MATSSAVMEHIKRLEKSRQEGAAVEVGQSTTTTTTTTPSLGTPRRTSNKGGNARSVKDPSPSNSQTPIARKYGSTSDKSPSTFTTAATAKSTPPAWLAAKSAKPDPKGSAPEAVKPSKYGYSPPSKSPADGGNSSSAKNFSSRPSKPSKTSKQEDATKSEFKPIYSLPKKSTTEIGLQSPVVKGGQDADPPKTYGSANKYPYALPSKSTNEKISKLKKPDPPSPSKSSKKKAAMSSKKPDPPLKALDGKSTLPTVTLKPTNSAAAAELKRQKEEEDQGDLAKSLSNISTSSHRKSSLRPPGSLKPSSKKTSSNVEGNKKDGENFLNDGAINDHIMRLRQTSQVQPKGRTDDGADPYLDNYLKRVGDQRQKAEQVVKKQPDESKKNKKLDEQKNSTDYGDDTSPTQGRRSSNGAPETEDLTRAVAEKKKWLKNLTHEIVAERSQWLEEEKAKSAPQFPKEKVSHKDLGSSLSMLPMYDATDLMSEIQQSNAILETIKQRTAYDVQSVDTLTLGGLSMASRDPEEQTTPDIRKSTVEPVKEEDEEDHDHNKVKSDSESDADDSSSESDSDEDSDDSSSEEEEETEHEPDESNNQDSKELEAAMLAGLKRAEQDAAPYLVKTDPLSAASNKVVEVGHQDADDEKVNDEKDEENDEEGADDDKSAPETDEAENDKSDKVAHNLNEESDKDVSEEDDDDDDDDDEEATTMEESQRTTMEESQRTAMEESQRTALEERHRADMEDSQTLEDIFAKALNKEPADRKGTKELATVDKVKETAEIRTNEEPDEAVKIPAAIDEKEKDHASEDAENVDEGGEDDDDDEDEVIEKEFDLEESKEKNRERKKDKKSKKEKDPEERKKKDEERKKKDDERKKRHDEKKKKDERKKKDKKKDKKDKKKDKKSKERHARKEEKRGLLSSESLGAESTDDDEEAFKSSKVENLYTEKIDASEHSSREPENAEVEHKETECKHDSPEKADKLEEAKESATDAEMVKAADASGCGCIIL